MSEDVQSATPGELGQVHGRRRLVDQRLRKQAKRYRRKNQCAHGETAEQPCAKCLAADQHLFDLAEQWAAAHDCGPFFVVEALLHRAGFFAERAQLTRDEFIDRLDAIVATYFRDDEPPTDGGGESVRKAG